MRFHLGTIVNNRANVSPVLPDIPEEPSKWYISQWNQSEYIEAKSLRVDDPMTFDPRLGIARYAFNAADGHAHVWIYPTGSNNWVYELYEAGGTLIKTGGSNIFLTTDQMMPSTFNRKMTLDFDGKISKASIFGSPESQANGTVVSQIFAGLSMMFTDPSSHHQHHVFMQLGISASGKSVRRSAEFVCDESSSIALFGPNLSRGELILPYASDAGPLHHFHYDLNNYLSDLLATKSCNVEWSPAALQPTNWLIGGFYIGLETEASRGADAPQGVVETGFQVANITLVAH
ncbi:unnamed protein product [Sphagnum tenellum]